MHCKPRCNLQRMVRDRYTAGEDLWLTATRLADGPRRGDLANGLPRKAVLRDYGQDAPFERGSRQERRPERMPLRSRRTIYTINLKKTLCSDNVLIVRFVPCPPRP